MLIPGHCQCGNISFVLECVEAPGEIPARACACSFCTAHGGVWSALPSAKLRVRIKHPERVRRHTFATGTAEFHVCQQCGDVPLVTSLIDGRLFAVVNANVLQGIPPSLFKHSQADFDRESVEARLERRRRGWIADVSIA